MDITEVPVTQKGKGKKKKNKSDKTKTTEQPAKMETDVEVKEEKTEETVSFPPAFSVSDIKNKQRRHLLFLKLKQDKRKVKFLT